MWTSGVRARAELIVFTGNIKRILLLEPYDTNQALKQASEMGNSELQELKDDITHLTRQALQFDKPIEVGWYRTYMGHTVTFFDPNPSKKNGELIPDSDNAWAVVTNIYNKTGIADRVPERIYKADISNRDKYNSLLSEFEKAWATRMKIHLSGDKLLEGK